MSLKRKLIKIKYWILYKIVCRSSWKKFLNSESSRANWEITHHENNKKVILHYVPNKNYSNNDVKIELPYNQFEDLIKFLIRIG